MECTYVLIIKKTKTSFKCKSGFAEIYKLFYSHTTDQTVLAFIKINNYCAFRLKVYKLVLNRKKNEILDINPKLIEQ